MIISAHSTVITRCYVGRAGGEVMMDWFWSGAPRTWSLSAGVGGEVDTRHQCRHTTCSDIPQTQQHHPPRPWCVGGPAAAVAGGAMDRGLGNGTVS